MNPDDDTYTELPPTEIQQVFTDLQTEAADSTVSPVFICEFNDPVSPEPLLEEDFTRDGAYDAITFPHKISSEEEYYQVNAVLGVENGNGEKLDAELCPNWMRVYVRESANIDQLVSFFETLAEHHDFKIVVAESYLTPRK